MTDPSVYANLHGHTIFSVKDGHAAIDEYVARAASLGHPAVALTDHGAMAAAPQFVRAAEQHGITPIVGCEIYTTAGHSLALKDPEHRKGHHLTLLAENRVGYQNLMALSSAGYLEGFYYNPRVDHELLARHSAGIICLSGCLAGELAALLLADQEDKAHDLLGFYREVYGDRFYLELQNHGPLIPDQITLNRHLVRLARAHGIPAVGTNDSHFCRFEDAPAQRALLNIKGGLEIKSSPYTYVRSNEEMAQAFPARARWHTLAIAERIERYPLGDPTPKLPVSPLEIPDQHPGLTLAGLVRDGLQRRLDCSWADVPFAYEERMDTELDVIRQMGDKLGVPFERYLLTIADIARFCRQERIPFGPRGSAAGSLVCWTLGISEPDPLKEKLLFERFLNPHRVELPDVDMDFADDQRDRVLQYFVDTYGRENVARIQTYAAIAAKGAIRDAARIAQARLSRPYMEVGDALSAMVPHDTRPGGMPLEEALEDGSLLALEYIKNPDARAVLDIAKQLNGRMRGTGTHAAGVVIADRSLRAIVPLGKVTNVEKEVIKQQTQYEMGELEALGLLKFDILGLSTLAMMDHAARAIEAKTGRELDLWRLDTADPAVWEVFAMGDTLGLFQLGSRGMTRAIMSVQPRDIQELAMVIAIFRPGPIDNLPTIAARKHGTESYQAIHPSLDGVLRETYGIPVYQEQIMAIMQVAAGFSLSEADVVRKAMGKKKRDLMAKYEAQFAEGALAKGYSPDEARTIWGFVLPFADYGFNRAHAVCYAYLAYQSAWLKAHHPVEFYAAALSVESRAGSKSGETSQERIGGLVLEAKRRGLAVLPPTVQRPAVDFAPEGPTTIRYGLACIKGVGRTDAELIARAAAEAPFRNLADFALRTPKVNKKVYQELIQVGAMPFGTRPTLLNAVENLVKIRAKRAGRPRKGETDEARLLRLDEKTAKLFEEAEEKLTSGDYLTLPEADLVARLEWELEGLGMIVSPLPQMAGIPETCGLAALVEHVGETVCVTGVVSALTPFVTRKQKHMAYGTLVDAEGAARMVVWPRTWDRCRDQIKVGSLVVAWGRIDLEQEEGGGYRRDRHEADEAPTDGPAAIPASSIRFLCDEIRALEQPAPAPAATEAAARDRDLHVPNEHDYPAALAALAQLTQLAADHPGDQLLSVWYRGEALTLHLDQVGLLAVTTDYGDLIAPVVPPAADAEAPTPVVPPGSDPPVYDGPLKARMRELTERRG